MLKLFCSLLNFSISILCIRKLMPCPSISLKRFWNCPNIFELFGPDQIHFFLIFLVISNLLWPFSTHLLFFLHTPFLMKVCGKILFTADYHILTVSKCLYLYKRSKIVLHYTSKIHYSTVYIKTKKIILLFQIDQMLWIKSQELPTLFNIENHFSFSDRPNRRRKVAHA